MRKMKFRAWNKDMMMYWGVPFYEMFSNTGLPENPKDCIWMQHVGIEDKNKIGIYEDDIVRIVNTDGKIFNKEVFYSENYACFFIGNISVKEFKQSQWTSNYSLQVIGNIHENKELLEAHNGE